MNGRLSDDQIVEASRQAFLEEAREMLAQLEGALLALADGDDPEVVNAAFRAAHTIKGSAGLFGYHRVVAFAHEVESLLDRVRDGRLRVTDPVVTLLLECRDHVQRLLDEVAGSEQCDDHDAESARLGALLRRAAGDDTPLPVAPPPAPAPAAAAPAPAAPAAAPATAGAEADPDAAACDDAWLIHVQFGPQTFVNGFDPLSFIRYLPTVGEVLHIESLVEAVPALPALDPEQCHLGFAIRLAGAAGKADIEAAFRFAADDCTLRLLPPRSRLADMLRLVDSVTDDSARMGEILVRIGALTPAELQRLLALQADAAQPTLLGELAVAEGAAEPQLVQAVAARQEKLRQKGGDESRHVRVPADKLDRLITLIGELAIAGSSAQVMAQRLADAPLLEVTERMAQLVESARDDALRLRMVPIGETFARFRRVVRDVSAQLGKEVSLRITGGDAELDKAMVELIADPLMHLVRNALDHGLETPAQRVAAGKPAAGELHLHAMQEAGAIVIEVSDDGRGLNTARILAKAVERGLVAPGADLPDTDIVQLIFQPGFSTAEQVTDLSGRGVGMDVVRRNIEALRGEVTVQNRPGHGATVQIRLPLTLAMIDGFRIEVAGASFIVPLEQVVECIESPPEAARLEAAALAGCFDLRGEVLPFLHLRRRFRLEGTPCERPSVVVVRCNGRKAGLLVDRLLGEHQTVIKPLGRLFRKLPGISGSTILGSGDVALILDVPSLVPPRSGGPPRTPTPTPRTDPRSAATAAIA